MKIKRILSKFAIFAVAIAVLATLSVPLLGQAKPVMAEAEEGKTADLYLIAGQSNAAGSTLLTATPTNEPEYYRAKQNVRYYGRTHMDINGGGGYYINDLRPVQQGCGFTSAHAGYELGLANVLNELPRYQDENTDAIIFKSAAGGTSVFPDGNYNNFGNWYPPTLLARDYPDIDLSTGSGWLSKEGMQYRAFMLTLQECMDKLAAEGYTTINVNGLFWMQGETDRGRVVQYKEVLPVLISDFRRDIGEITGVDCSNMPFYIGEISKTFSSASASSVAENERMIAAQHEIAGIVPYTYVAKLSHMLINDFINGEQVVVGSDSSHWNYADIVSVGEIFAELYMDTGCVFEGTYLDKFVDVEIDSSALTSAVNPVRFLGECGGNYNAQTEKIQFEIQTPITQALTDFTVANATLTKLETKYEDVIPSGYKESSLSLAPVTTYEITNITGDVKISGTMQKNNSYVVDVTTSDTTYGQAPDPLYLSPAFVGCRYALRAIPKSNGAVEKLIVNGVEIPGSVTSDVFTFDNIEQYAIEGSTTINIELVYGEFNEVKEKLEAAEIPENPENPENHDGGNKGNCKSSGNFSSILALMTACAACFFIVKRK